MGVIAEERQRRGRPRAATNPKGTWGLRPHASLLVVNDATSIDSSSRLAWDSQAPCARPMPLLGQAPKIECLCHEAIRARLESSCPGDPDRRDVDRPVPGGRSATQSPPGAVEPLPPAARGEPGRLVSLGRAGAPEGREG